MRDDGWRHLAMALHEDEVKSWGRVFAHSLYGDFDPWFMWHKLLYVISLVSGEQYIHIVINSFVLFLLSIWFFNMLRLYSSIPLWIIIILSIYLPMTSGRYLFLRPDILSGLFLLYFILLNKKRSLFILSILYAPMYYVFWFYFGYLGFVQLILKEYKNMFILAFAMLFGFLFYFYIDFDGYIQITKNVLNNDLLTQGHFVGESQPYLIPISIKNIYGSSVVLAFLLIFFVLVFYILKPKSKPLYYLVLFAPLIFLQVRFSALLFPLVQVVILIYTYKLYEMIQKDGLIKVSNQIITQIKQRSYFGDINKIWWRRIIIFIIFGYLISSYISIKNHYKLIEKSYISAKVLQNKEFINKKIMFTKMDTLLYMSVYINPTASYIPGCSLGWVDYDKTNRDTYFKVITADKTLSVEEFFKFVKYNNVDYIIIQMETNKMTISKDIMNKYGYKFYKFFENNIIFKRIML
jgi:hypothetical protein